MITLHALQNHLPKNIRNDFLKLHGQGPLIGHLNTLNSCFIPILDFLVLFKSDLGLALQRMIEAYNIIILMQYESYCSVENLKTKEYEEKLKELQEIQKEVYNQKDNQDM